MIHIGNPTFIAGWSAFQDGLPEEANPFLFEANPWRLWSAGWRVAMLISVVDEGIYEMPGDAVNTEAGLRRIEKSGFVQGQVAYRKSIPLSDCPYDPGTPFYNDWQAGWEWEQRERPQIKTLAAPELERLGWFAWLARLWPFRRP